MSSVQKSLNRSKLNKLIWLPVNALLLLALACSLPGFGERTQAPPVASQVPTETSAPPRPTPQPLPPALVEINPLPGGELPLQEPVTFYFNQPMETTSVEAALTVEPPVEGVFNWQDDATLIFQPRQPLAPESAISFKINTSARSREGLSMAKAVNLEFRTVGFLRVTQTLPEAGAVDVNPTSAIVAAFNRPVVSLGAENDDLPVPFTIEPGADGRGEWINTSTYIFYPEPALIGGAEYSILIDPNLLGVEGSPLDEAINWSFSTAAPELVSITADYPEHDEYLEALPRFISLDSSIILTFNQPMDTNSVEASFSMLGPGGVQVPGKAVWNEDNTEMTFTPEALLERSTAYSAELGVGVRSAGGTLVETFTSFSFTTYPEPAVIGTNPFEGGVLQPYNSIIINLSTLLNDKNDHTSYIDVTPRVPNLGVWWNYYEQTLNVYGEFAPETNYTLTISPNLPDRWGGTINQEYRLNFRTGSLLPQLTISTGTDVLFLTPQDKGLIAQVTNLYSLPVSVGSVPLVDFLSMVSGENAWDRRQSYRAADERTWQQSFELEANKSQAVEIALSPEGASLKPGLYYMRPRPGRGDIYAGPFLLVVANTNLIFKLSATEALVWAMNLENGQPIANAPVAIYNEAGAVMTFGSTDAEGLFRGEIEIGDDPYRTFYAVVGQPGEEGFGMALSTWDMAIASWDFGILSDYSGPHLFAYLYTDRPIYRPGQTIYFRGIVREAYNGRYELPQTNNIQLTVYGTFGEEMFTLDMPISAFGTTHGQFTLPPDAQPGDYRLASKGNEYRVGVNFQIAEYRKPEIDLKVEVAQGQILAGEALVANVEARYFFDAPAGNLPVKWALYQQPSGFTLPDYQVGVTDHRWLSLRFFAQFFGGLGTLVEEGEATTNPQGELVLEIATPTADARQRYTVEVTIQDESGLPVSARASLEANPATFYIGVRPDAYVGRADEPSGFDIQIVDWEGKPASVKSLRAEFQKVVWVRDDSQIQQRGFESMFTPQYTLVGSTDFLTSTGGMARLEFTPPEPGTYQLDVFGEGARTEILLWVGGPGQPVWPNLPNQRMRLVSDRETYEPGDTARVFVPNPFPTETLAFITVERGLVMRQQVEKIQPGGQTLELPLGIDDAPNVYVVVTLFGKDDGGRPDFRHGILNLEVSPAELTLQVSATIQPERAGPGDQVRIDLQVNDRAGAPVSGEFSLSVVDKAVLALADPNVPDIVTAFYDEQPLGVRTGLSLSAYSHRLTTIPGGIGGGGGDGLYTLVARDVFPDTAYWQATITTDSQGRAQVSFPLPDNLTTWQVLVRGVAEDTRVGQAESEIITSKELLVRPVVPRFFVIDDRVLLAAVVQNNSSDNLQATVSLQAFGVNLLDGENATQQVFLPSQGRERVEWWGQVQNTEFADLVFSVEGTDQASGRTYQDAARPALGKLPVVRFNAPQTFSTSGTLGAEYQESGGELLELVSLPRTYDTRNGSLKLELASSLGGAMLNALEALENYPYECTEQTLARFLPNLETYQALKQFSMDAPALQSRLERTLEEGLQRLITTQNSDGGWGWWQNDDSDPFITAYVLHGLERARRAGSVVSERVMRSAADYLYATLLTPQITTENWQLDRLAFIHFALAQAGYGDVAGAQSLYEERARLNPWAQAMLALGLDALEPESEAARTLISNLEATAIRSANGAHWEEDEPGWQNMNTPISTSAMVIYALAQHDPNSPLLAEAVRYLMAHRQADGAWNSTYGTSWTIMAMNEVMKGTGELGGEFAFGASVNDAPVASGQAGGSFAPVTAEIPLSSLFSDMPNALRIQRESGTGKLYYAAALQVFRPVEATAPLQRGVSVARTYYPIGDACAEAQCEPIESIQTGNMVRVHLTLTVNQDTYYLMVEDYIPAGSEIQNTQLKTSQFGYPEEPQPEPILEYDPSKPFANGWGWWLFSEPIVYDDHIAWSASYLPPGTYELTYTLITTQPGEFRVLPGRAWMFYFPEVQGNSAGSIFTITE